MSEERETYTAGAPALDLDDIEARCFRVRYNLTQYGVEKLVREDIPALIAEVRRLRDLVAELEEMKAVAVRVDQSWRRNYCDCVNERDAAEDEAKKLRANIQRIGRERDQMIAANVELQERLSALEDDGK